MFVLVNPYAAGGRAGNRWSVVRDALIHEGVGIRECVAPSPADLLKEVRAAVDSGEVDLVAAGGDGTVNALLNAVMNCTEQSERRQLRFGAVGLGSSNDFHKPVSRTRAISGIPVAIDGANACPRDVGKMTFINGHGKQTRWFMINASLGVTAEANARFSHPDRFLRWLKRGSTPCAIWYAAVASIVMARNVPVSVSAGNHQPVTVALSNLAILKSPYVSGSLKFPGPFGPANGVFRIVLHHSLGRAGLLSLLFALGRGTLDGSPAMTFDAATLVVSSRVPLAVECDGETFQSRHVECSLLPKTLMVCA